MLCETSKRRPILWIIGALLCASWGCGGIEPGGIEPGAPADAVGVHRAAIVNGIPDPKHPAVGPLLFDPNGLPACTATLIHPQVLLTAAHCVEALGAGSWARFGDTLYRVGEVAAHEDYESGTVGTADVGLAVLDTPIDGIDPVPLAFTAPEVGEFVALIGYGAGPGTDGEPQKNIAYNRIAEVGPDNFTYERAGGGIGNTCHGDSGGPTLRIEDSGREVLLGVHSGGSKTCGETGRDMAVDAYVYWIEDQIATLFDGSDQYASPQRVLGDRPQHVLGTCQLGGGPTAGATTSLVLVLLLGLHLGRARARARASRHSAAS